MAIKDLLTGELCVVNIGLLSFKESLEQSEVQVIHVDWRPPAEGDDEVLAALKKLMGGNKPADD